MASVLPEVERIVEDAVAQLHDSNGDKPSLWNISGKATAGKSSALLGIASLLQGSNLKPVIVAPPVRHMDTGPVALVQVASGLAKHGLLNGEYERWLSERQSWSKRLNDVRGWLQDHGPEIVLLCDEPRQWPAPREQRDVFARRTDDVVTLLIDQAACARVVAGPLPASSMPATRFHLQGASPDSEWLTDPEVWGPAIDAALAVVGALDTTRLTPLEIRLAVAGVALTSVDEVQRWLSASSPRLPQRLAGLVSTNPEHRELWKAWNALSLTRRPFPPALLEELPYRLDAAHEAVLRNCLLFGDDSLRLHDVLRVQAARWRETNRDTSMQSVLNHANRRLFSFYRSRFEDALAAVDPDAAVESMEAYHFGSNTGDASLMREVQPYFVEQLDALGWSLSYQHHRFGAAADVFAEALNWDSEDDYAHHYLAFNLERSSGDVTRIDRHYRSAIDHNEEHPWWHSRYILFLLSRGRVADARLRWEDALVALGVGEGDADASLYESLHCWVAGALLANAELDFAREVLDEVPDWAQRSIPDYDTLRQRLTALLEAHEWGAFIPASRLRPRWWERGPELLQDRLGTGQRLVRWLAARLESLDKDGAHLQVADVAAGRSRRPQIGAVTLSVADFERFNRDDVALSDIEPGSHLEIGLYAPPDDGDGGTVTILRILDPPDWHDESLHHYQGARYRPPNSNGT